MENKIILDKDNICDIIEDKEDFCIDAITIDENKFEIIAERDWQREAIKQRNRFIYALAIIILTFGVLIGMVSVT